MGEHTGIAWTDATFNIAWGCMKVSPGCHNCYADNASHRFGFDVFGPAKTTARRTFGAQHWREPLVWNRKAARAGVRRRVFCSSMCDVFEDHPTIDAERAKLWPLIRATPMLDWQLLTKRPERMAANLPWDAYGDPWPNVWLGTSIESQDYLTRARILATIPAAIRFISAEPLLGPIDFDSVLSSIDWLIVGGESQPGCRPMDPDWAREIVASCAVANVPVFLKQLGGHPDARAHAKATIDGERYVEMPA